MRDQPRSYYVMEHLTITVADPEIFSGGPNDSQNLWHGTVAIF